MKRIFSILLMAITAISVCAQKDITKFLGIPINGTKAEMKRKLIAKGFKPVPHQDFLRGQFNGEKVRLFIGTNRGKVYRIYLADVNTRDEADIKVRFNNLVHQFQNNPRYTAMEQQMIPEDEDIRYEITIHNKIYSATFYQNINKLKLEKIREILREQYTEEQLQNPTRTIQKSINNTVYDFLGENFLKKVVWFRIEEHYGSYYISMYYDNGYNAANGEEL